MNPAHTLQYLFMVLILILYFSKSHLSYGLFLHVLQSSLCMRFIPVPCLLTHTRERAHLSTLMLSSQLARITDCSREIQRNPESSSGGTTKHVDVQLHTFKISLDWDLAIHFNNGCLRRTDASERKNEDQNRWWRKLYIRNFINRWGTFNPAVVKVIPLQARCGPEGG